MKSRRSTALLVTAAILATVTLLLALRLPRGLANFRKIFEELGVTPPPITTMVLNAPYVWWLLAAAAGALFAWVVATSSLDEAERKRMKLALGALIVITVVVYGFTAYWIYLPIFTLRATV